MRFTPIIASFVLATCAHGQHIVEILPPDGFEACSPRDLSTSGDVVVGNASGTGSRFAAFRWTPDTGSEVLPGLPGLPAKWASAVSADGRTILGSVESEFGEVAVVLWQADGSIERLDLPTSFVRISGIGLSEDGTVAAGFGVDADDSVRAWRWTRQDGVRVLPLPAGTSVVIPLALSGDGSSITGFVRTATSALGAPFRWTEQSGFEFLPMPPGSEGVQPRAASFGGNLIVGDWFSDALCLFPYAWSADRGFIELPPAGPELAFGSGSVSPDGTVWIDRPSDGALLWREDLGLYEFEDVLEARGVRLSSLRTNYISNISPDGTAIIGLGDDRPHASGGIDRAWLITNFALPTDCPPDIDLNGTLDAFDFLAFLDRFAEGDLRADLDGDGELTGADLVAFQAAFDAGC